MLIDCHRGGQSDRSMGFLYGLTKSRSGTTRVCSKYGSCVFGYTVGTERTNNYAKYEGEGLIVCHYRARPELIIKSCRRLKSRLMTAKEGKDYGMYSSWGEGRGYYRSTIDRKGGGIRRVYDDRLCCEVRYFRSSEGGSCEPEREWITVEGESG